jgi:hypothetical protein
MREEPGEQDYVEIIRKRRREIALYNRMLKTSDIKENQRYVLTVGLWKEDAQRAIEHARRQILEIREEKRNPKYRWSD